MRRTLTVTAAVGAALLSGATAASAQAPAAAPQATNPQGTDLGTPMTQPQPGGSVLTGAPTSALPSAGGGPGQADAATQGRGPPIPGGANPPPLRSVTGSSQIGPTGAIIPGAEGAEAGTGGSQTNSNP